MMEPLVPPDEDEFELTLLGPGYGESIVLHIGEGSWVIVDSCLQEDRSPAALGYLQKIGIDSRAVELVVATHWHDDHIRGMAQLLQTCENAVFCCASALCEKEFLTIVGALGARDFSAVGPGIRETYNVFSQLSESRRKVVYAIENRRILSRGRCDVWSLSPDDIAYSKFLRRVGLLVPNLGESKRRVPRVAPNDVSVVLRIEAGTISVLLGGDLEKRGWAGIIDRMDRPTTKASVFKIPHHGSKDAHQPKVWEEMLEDGCVAVLAPWCRGRRFLPTAGDVARILASTPNAYSTTGMRSLTRSPFRRSRVVDRAIRESGIRLQVHRVSPGGVRLRRRMDSSAQWQVRKIGSGCHLSEFMQ